MDPALSDMARQTHFPPINSPDLSPIEAAFTCDAEGEPSTRKRYTSPHLDC